MHILVHYNVNHAYTAKTVSHERAQKLYLEACKKQGSSGICPDVRTLEPGTVLVLNEFDEDIGVIVEAESEFEEPPDIDFLRRAKEQFFSWDVTMAERGEYDVLLDLPNPEDVEDDEKEDDEEDDDEEG